MTNSQLGTAEFYDAEALTVFFATKPEIIKHLLPPPLKPAKSPVGFVFVANYPKTSFGVSYLESALFVTAEWGGEEGAYCLAMPVTNDLALILGREIFGYPKKMGTIFFKRQQDTVEGWTERRGVRLLEVRAQLTGRLNQEGAEAAMQTVFQPNHDLIFYTYKVFPSPTTRGFDYPPRLIRNVVKLHRSTVAVGMAELMLRSSGHDPWGEVEVVQVLGALYTKGNSLMLPGTVVAEVDPDAFAPYALMKLDSLTNE